MAEVLSFETGVVEYDVNGSVKIRFNPADTAFVEKLYNVFNDLDARQEEFQAHIDSIGDDSEELFAYAKERDQEMRAIIDELFGEGVSDGLFPDMNCYALADGLPVWINFIFAVCEKVSEAFTEGQKKADPRMRTYSKKYEDLRKKYTGKKTKSKSKR